jgi:hypothetical protein
MTAPLQSRKRKAETAIRATFIGWAGTNLTLSADQIILGRSLTEQAATHIRIHCASQEPHNADETLPILNYKVTGSITVESSADAYTRDEVSTLEGMIESFIETDQSEMLPLLGTYAGTNVGFWNWNPIQAEDGIDAETRRFISTYTFETVVGHAPFNIL